MEKAAISIPLGVGLASDVAEDILPLGSALDLENAFCLRTGEAVKRLGTAILGGNPRMPYALGTHKGALVATFAPGGDPLAVRDGAGRWTSPGSGLDGLRAGPVTHALTRIATDAQQPDIAAGGNYFCVAYKDSTSRLKFALVDQITGTTATVIDVASGVAAYRPIVCNGFAVLVYTLSAGGDLLFQRTNLTTLASATVAVVGATAGGPDLSGRFDVRLKDATTISVVYPDNAFVARAQDYVPGGATTAWQPRTAAAGAIACDQAGGLAWLQDFGGSGKIALASADVANGVRVHWDLATSGATRNATTTYTLDAGATANVLNMAGHTTAADATGAFVVLYTLSAAAVSGSSRTNNRVALANRVAGSISAAMTLCRSVTLESKTWTAGGGYFVCVGYRSDAQGNRYVLGVPAASVPPSPSQAAPLAIIGRQEGFPRSFEPAHSNAVALSATSVAFAFAYRPRFDISGAPAFNPDVQGVAVAVVTHAPLPNTTIAPPLEAIDSTLVPHGMLGQYDGVTYAEAGFAYYPEPVIANFSFTAGANAKSYKFTYAYMDAQARLWRSRDSVAIQISTNGGAVTVNAPTLRVCGRANVRVEFWRTDTNTSTLFRKVGSVANSLTADTVAFVDNVSDATMDATGEELYTDGGVLPNDTLPSCTVFAIGAERAFVRDEDDRQTIWPSMPFTLKGGAVFSEETAFDIRDRHGDVTALAMLGANVIAFKSDAIYAVSGAGPDVLGRGGYTVTLLASGVGSVNPQSIVETKDGVFFQSTGQKAGMYLVNRGGSVEYIGGGVQKYIGNTIVGALQMPSFAQVRFYTSQARSLVYDVVSQLWSTFTTNNAASAVSLNGTPIYSDTGGVIWSEDGAGYSDNGTPYTWTVGTPWIKLAGLRGYERITRLTGVGERAGVHTLTVALYRDYDGTTPFKTLTVTPGAQWDWQAHYSAKMSALKIVLSESSTTAGAKAATVELEYGVRGSHKPSTAAKRAA